MYDYNLMKKIKAAFKKSSFNVHGEIYIIFYLKSHSLCQVTLLIPQKCMHQFLEI